MFEDINKNKYESIFENSSLGWYRDLHESYGVVISCYVYYEDGDFNLSKFPSRYKDEFIQNSSWLRFGFHTINGDTNYQSGNITSDYLKTVKEMERIAGSESIDNVVRLQMLQGSYNEIKELTELEDQPVKGFLTADDNRQSYYLSEDENTYIYNHDEYYDNLTDLYFFSTDFRTEYVTDINAKLKELKSNCWYNQTGDLVVFSHEWALSLENKEKIEQVCNYAKNEGYRFEFFEDIISHSN